MTPNCLWLIIIMVLSCWESTFPTCLTPQDEVSALYSLYIATEGSQWQWKTNYTAYGIPWNFTSLEANTPIPASDPCQFRWQGIECSSSSYPCSITSLALSNYTLIGTLPQALTNLTQLHVFDLSYNPGIGLKDNISIDIDLSVFLTAWPHLQTLNLKHCSLSTFIPDSITWLQNLTALDLSYNFITGTIPWNLTALVMLEYIYLQGNKLHGTIPSPISLTSYPIVLALDVSANHLVGSIPYDLGDLPVLGYCNLSFNHLTSTIPESLGIGSNQYFLVDLILNNNQLTGPALPPNIGNLYFLNYISINDNALNSSLPDSFYTLRYLVAFYSQNNKISGSLSNEFGQLINIILFTISDNYVTGRIPDSINNLHYLTYAYFDGNFLSGTLPSTLFQGQLGDYWISQFSIANNRITGKLPSNLFTNGRYLQYVDVSLNQITGELPNAYNVSLLQLIYANSNQLTSSLPDWSNLPLLYEIDLHSNYITNTLPNYFFTKEYDKTFYSLFLQDNVLTGSLPSLSTMIVLQYFRIDKNCFTGSIVDSFELLQLLTILNISNNHFNGYFPTTLRYTPIQSLDLSNNKFYGNINIPNNNGKSFEHLTQLFLQSNQFTGSLDFLMNCSKHVSTENPTIMPSFSPSPPLVDNQVIHSLSVIDVSDNAFTSTLPYQLFTNSLQLTVFAAVKNCLTGSLSDKLCGNKGMSRDTIVVLALDGLHSSLHCQHHIFPASSSLITTYLLDSFLSGSIPQCLFTDMPVLQTLHLSGNGIKGSLPSNLTILSPLLSDLSLSHNRLSSSIPIGIQSRQWKNLDLSFNLFCGEIDNQIYSMTSPSLNNDNNRTLSLSLQMNRLSGKIPSKLGAFSNINILEGNLFNCGFTRNELPRNDPNYESYQCGSNTFNDAAYLWIVVLIGTMGVVIVVGMKGGTGNIIVDEQEQEEEESDNQTVSELLISLSTDIAKQWSSMYDLFLTFYLIRSFSCSVAIVCVLVLMPLYSVMSTYYNVYNHTYAYALSFSFDSGLTPTITMFIIFSIFLILMFSKAFGKVLLSTSSGIPFDKRMMIFVIKRGTSCWERLIIRIERCFYHLNLHCIWRQVVWLRPSLVNDHNNKDESDNSIDKPTTLSSITSSSTSTTTTTDMNNITIDKYTIFIITCSFIFNVIVVMTVNMAFIYAMTTHVTNNIKTIITIIVSLFKLAWNTIFRLIFSCLLSHANSKHYHMNQLTNDIHYDGKFMLPFLLFVSLFNNIMVPCLAVAVISSNCFLYAIIPSPSVSTTFSLFDCVYELFFYTQETTACAVYSTLTYETTYQPPFDYNYQCSSTLLTNFAGLFVYRFTIGRIILPLIEILMIKPLQRLCIQRYGTNYWLSHLCTRMLSVIHRPVELINNSNVNSTSNNVDGNDGTTMIVTTWSSSNDIIKSKCEDIFPCRQHIVSFTTDIAIMLSFGFIFPPLFLIGFGSLWVSTKVIEYMIHELLRYVQRRCDCRNDEILIIIIDKVNKACHKCLRLLVTAIQSLSIVLAIFWSLFLFDTLGESRGPLIAMWMPITLVSISLIITFRNKHVILPSPIDAHHQSGGSMNTIYSERNSVDNNMVRNKNKEIEMQISIDRTFSNTNNFQFNPMYINK